MIFHVLFKILNVLLYVYKKNHVLLHLKKLIQDFSCFIQDLEQHSCFIIDFHEIFKIFQDFSNYLCFIKDLE